MKRIEAVRRGEVPEGYQKAHPYIIPDEWQVTKLGDVTRRTFRPNKDGQDRPVYSINNRKGFVPQSEQFEEGSYEGLDKSAYKIVREGEFAYNPARINVGSIGRLKGVDEVAVSSLYVCVRVDDEINGEYFDAWTKSRNFYKETVRNTEGSVREYLFYENFSNMRMPLPPFAEQQKIAEILATCDRMIELKQQLLEEKRRQKQWLMQKLLDPNSATVVEKRLGDVCTINDCGIDGLSGDNEVFYIDIAAVDNGEIMLPASPIKLQDAPVRARRTFKRGDILMSTVRPYLHAFAYVDFDADNYVASTGFSILRAKNGVSSRLIYQLLFTAEMDKQYGSVLVGSNYPALNTSDVESLVVFIPENHEKQEAVANTLAVADQQIRLLNSEIEAWQQKKKALMQLLLTGLVRVNA